MSMDKRIIKTSVALICSALLASCANTTVIKPQAVGLATAKTPVIVPVKKATNTPSIEVNWQNVEAATKPQIQNQDTARFAQSATMQMMAKSYAAGYGVSLTEARRRLMLQDIASIIIEAINNDLGDAFVGGYLDNDSNEYKVGITTLDNVKAERYDYPIIMGGQQVDILPIIIKPVSDKTEAQISQLIEQYRSEITKRYPNIQLVGYDPVNNVIDVLIYNKDPKNGEQERIEAELTKLMGHPVKVEFIEGRIEVM